MRGDRWFFDRVAPVYDYVVPPADPAVLSEALDRANRPIERVVDVGGGTGRAIRAIDAGERVLLDASRPMLERAPTDLHRVRADARALPLRSADAVLIVDALHHLPERERVLEEAIRVLRPGGVLVIREFDPSTIRGRLLRVAEHALGMDSRFATADELAGLASEAGLEATVIDRGFACTVVGRKPGRDTIGGNG